MLSIQTILHPTDFSDASLHALDVAYALAQEHGARLILLHVQEPQEVIEGEFGMIPPEPQPADETILAALDQLLSDSPSIQMDCMVAHGVVAEEIVRVAREIHRWKREIIDGRSRHPRDH